MGISHKVRQYSKLAATSVAVTATLALSSPAMASPSQPPPQGPETTKQTTAQVRQAPALSPHLDRVMQTDKQFLGLEDPAHKNMNLRTILSHPENMATARANNYKHVFLEMTTDIQPAIDAYQKGAISREQFKEAMGQNVIHTLQKAGKESDDFNERFTRTLDLAKEQGISVHAVDSDTTFGSYSNSPALRAVHDKAFRAWKPDPSLHIDKSDIVSRYSDAFCKYRDSYLKNMPRREQEALMKKMLDERLLEDPTIAKNIEKLSNGERSIIIYGEHHMGNFEKVLGKNRMARAKLDTDPHADHGVKVHATETKPLSGSPLGKLGI